MAKKTNEGSEISLIGDGAANPRLHKLIIKNFRSIGPTPVEIELDDIVILVGANNAGKSSILRAYEIVMQHGSKDGRLVIDDFPNGRVDTSNLPEVELHTIIYHDLPGKQWIETTSNQELLIRERWTWKEADKDPVRQGFNATTQEWDSTVPWGAPNVANARRPQPHHIDAFASPDSQANAIIKIVTGLLSDRLGSMKSDPSSDKSDLEVLFDRIRDLQTRVVNETMDELESIQQSITQYVSSIFPNHRVLFDPKADIDPDKTYTPFKANPVITMGQDGGHFSSIAHQGSGARRTLLWTILKHIADKAQEKTSRPSVLLLDEPEICLHPSAVRDARNVLYSLPSNGMWQVMLTTHSPLFIDLSYDNTTVIRVFKDENADVRSTTLYRPSRAQLSSDDKENMKLLNICDPYLHEFFFGGRQVIVEGDTEYTAFSYIKARYPDKYSDVHVIRARGKGIIPSVARVLLQFSKSFSILHDIDSRETKTGGKNPAWTLNASIQNILSLENAHNVQIVACDTNFEVAILGTNVISDKPYAILERIRSEVAVEAKVKSLLDSLIDPDSPPPVNCIRIHIDHIY